MKKIFFRRRIPEPKEMALLEHKVFERLSKDNYSRWFIPLVDDILSQYRGRNGVVLDVASGPGFLVKELALRSGKFKIIGIDNSRHAIRIARSNCYGLKNVKFILASVNRLPFPDKNFDLVVCKDSLHHFPNLTEALKEILRVVKLDGLVYIQDLKRDLPQYILQQSFPPDNLVKKLQFYSARASYKKEEVEKALRQLGLKNYKIRIPALNSANIKRYKKMSIDLERLKESLKTRMAIIIMKQKWVAH